MIPSIVTACQILELHEEQEGLLAVRVRLRTELVALQNEEDGLRRLLGVAAVHAGSEPPLPRRPAALPLVPPVRSARQRVRGTTYSRRSLRGPTPETTEAVPLAPQAAVQGLPVVSSPAAATAQDEADPAEDLGGLVNHDTAVPAAVAQDSVAPSGLGCLLLSDEEEGGKIALPGDGGDTGGIQGEPDISSSDDDGFDLEKMLLDVDGCDGDDDAPRSVASETGVVRDEGTETQGGIDAVGSSVRPRGRVNPSVARGGGGDGDPFGRKTAGRPAAVSGRGVPSPARGVISGGRGGGRGASYGGQPNGGGAQSVARGGGSLGGRTARRGAGGSGEVRGRDPQAAPSQAGAQAEVPAAKSRRGGAFGGTAQARAAKAAPKYANLDPSAVVKRRNAGRGRTSSRGRVGNRGAGRGTPDAVRGRGRHGAG